MNNIATFSAMRRREALIGLAFLSPWLLGFVLFKLVPILLSFAYSLTDFDMREPKAIQFIGLENYFRFLGDSAASASLAGSLGYFLFTVPVQMVLALGMAIIFSSDRLKIKGFLRPFFFMPSIIPAVTIFLIYIGLVDPNTGWLNVLILRPLGLPPTASPFSSSSFAILTALLSIWSMGPGFLIMLGAIQAIPREIIEAARVDGAGPISKLVFITLPMISPAIFFSLVINLTSAFGGSVLLDRGLIFGFSLSPMEQYITDQMFGQFDLGYACALAWIMMLVTLSITIWLFQSARSWVYFPEENNQNEM